jgi:hypothetical protein
MREGAALPTRHDTALNDVNGYTAVFVLREQICAVRHVAVYLLPNVSKERTAVRFRIMSQMDS